MEKEEEKLSMSARTEEAIVQLILDKNWQPGQQIPPEPELCTLLGASRNTLREAIRALVARNVLEIRRGNGTFVSGRMGVPDDPLGLAFVAHPGRLPEELMDIRQMMEPSIAILAAEKATDEDIAELRRCMEAYEEAVALGQDPTSQDIAFHKQIARCTQNQVLPNLIPVISESIRAFSHLQPPMKVRSTILAHRDIYEAIAARSPSRARDAMNIHLAEALRKLRKSRLKEDDED